MKILWVTNILFPEAENLITKKGELRSSGALAAAGGAGVQPSPAEPAHRRHRKAAEITSAILRLCDLLQRRFLYLCTLTKNGKV